MKMYDVVQGSESWHKLRLGRPTASNFKKVMTAVGAAYSKQSISYIAQLIQETKIPWMPERAEAYTSRSMKWGREMEEEARRWYSLETGYEVRKVGFITTDDGRFGGSPDALVFDNGTPIGGLELKCTDPDSNVHTEWLLAGGLPSEHKAQVQGYLHISGLPWWDFVSYPPPPNEDGERLPPLRVRVIPDEWTQKLAASLELFWADYQKAKDRLSKLGA